MEPEEKISGIYELFLKLVDALELERKGAVYLRALFLEEADRLIREVRSHQQALASRLQGRGSKGKDPSLLKYASIHGHIDRICEHMENMSKALSARCMEGIRFSDKAADEVDYLFGELKDILSGTSSLLAGAKDIALAGSVGQAELAFSVSVGGFEVRHGERIAHGICLPRASSIYMEMLDSFRAIAWHSKEIAQELQD